MQYYPIVRRLYLLYGLLKLVQGQSSGASIPPSSSANSEGFLPDSNAPVSSTSPTDTSIAALTAFTTSTPSSSPSSSNIDATSIIEQTSSTFTSQTQRNTFSSMTNTLASNIFTTADSTTSTTSPIKVSETSEALHSKVASSASSSDLFATSFSTAEIQYQTSQSQASYATNMVVGSNSDLSASTSFVVTTSQSGAIESLSAFDSNFNFLEVDSYSSSTSSRNPFTSSTFTSSTFTESSIPTTSLGSTTSAISTITDRLSKSSTESAATSTVPAATSTQSAATSAGSAATSTSTVPAATSTQSAATSAGSAATSTSTVTAETPTESTASDMSMRILNEATSTESTATSIESAAISTQSTATSTEPAATSTESAATSTVPAATSTGSAATSTVPADTSTESAAKSTVPAAKSKESEATSAEPVATSTQSAATSTEPAATSTGFAATSTSTVTAETPTESTASDMSMRILNEATSTESTATSTESAAISTQSTAISTQSTATSTEPAATSTESAATSTVPAATSTGSEATSTVPADTSTESAATSTVPAAKSKESEATSTEPAATSTQSAATSAGSAATSKESAATSTVPAAKSKESAATSTVPLETSTDPTGTSTEATGTSEYSATTVSAETSSGQPDYLVFTLSSTPVTSNVPVSNSVTAMSDSGDSARSIPSYSASYLSQESSGNSIPFKSITSNAGTFSSTSSTFSSGHTLDSFTEADTTSGTSFEISITPKTTNTAATLTASPTPESYTPTYTESTTDSSSTTPVALSTTSETSTSYSSQSQGDVTFTTSTPFVILDSSTYSTEFSSISEATLTFLTSNLPSDTSIISTKATETQAFTESFSSTFFTSQADGSLLGTSTFETAKIVVSSSFTNQDLTSAESLYEKTSEVASIPLSSASSTDQQFSATSSENPIPVPETTLTHGSSSLVYFSSSTQETSTSTDSINPEDTYFPSSLAQSSTLRSDSSPVEAQNSQSGTSSISDASTTVDTIGRSQTISPAISSQVSTVSSPNFQSAANSYSKETLATISSLPGAKQSAESPSSTNAPTASLGTILASPTTIATTSMGSSHWLPTAIVVQSSLPSTYSSTFNPSVTATLPHIIAPPTPVVPVANSTIITVGFKLGLNYEFLVNNPLASAQIFAFLPSLLVYPFLIDNFQEVAILFARANYYISYQVEDSTTILSPEGSRDTPNNHIRDVQYASVDVSSVKVIQIVPLVVSGRNYLISVAEVYFPTDHVSALQKYVLNVNSTLYNNTSQTLSALADLIDPSISLTGLLDGEGYGNGNGNAGNSGGSSPSGQVVTTPQNGKNNDANTGSLETSNSTSHIAFSIMKRLLIYLTCLASGTLLWILLILFVYKVLYGKKRTDKQASFGELHMFYEKRLESAADVISVRTTNSTIHSSAMNEKCDFPKTEKGSTSSELNFESAEDLIITGENTVYSTVHGLEYFVDEDGSFYYAGAIKSTNKENESITEDSGYTENINNYLYSANEGRSAVAIDPSLYDIGSLEVDEDGNFVLPVTSLEKELGGTGTENSDTVESYNNNNLYKLRKTLISDEMDTNGNSMSDNIVGASDCTKSDESSDAHIIDDSLTNIANRENNSKKNASSNSDSNGLMNLPLDFDNFDEYMYQERDEQFQGHLDVKIDDIDDDHVADVQIDELDELDEEMYKRLSKIMTQKQNSRVTSNLHVTRTNSNMLYNLSASAVTSIDDMDAKGLLQKGANAVHNDAKHPNLSNGELKNVNISSPLESRNSLGW